MALEQYEATLIARAAHRIGVGIVITAHVRIQPEQVG
jgi:hypothetical protein